MKSKFLLFFILAVFISGMAGCALLNKPIEFVDEFINTTFFPSYSGPKAKVIVADFEVMTAKATTDISSNLRDILISGLLKSQRFELASLPKDSVDKLSGLIIASRLMDFEPYGSGGKSGVGGAGSAASGSLYSLLGSSVNRSYISLDIRIVDAATSKVLFSERISAQASKDYSPEEEDRRQDKREGQGLDAYAGTSMEEAINKCILEAVKYIIQKVPPEYYKGGAEDGKTQAQGKT